MNSIRFHSLLSFVILAIPACAAEVPEEERSSTSQASNCPSPVEDPDGFHACVRSRAGSAKSSANGKNNQSSKGGRAGNGGTESESANGGSIEIGDIDASGCSNLTITCVNDACTCSSSSVPKRPCKDDQCVTLCCPGG